MDNIQDIFDNYPVYRFSELGNIWFIVDSTVLLDEEHFMAGIGVLVLGHLNDPNYKRLNCKIAKNAYKKFFERVSKGDSPRKALEIAYNIACNGRKDLVGRAIYVAFPK